MTQKPKQDKYGFDSFFEIMTSSKEYEDIMGRSEKKIKAGYTHGKKQESSLDFESIAQDIKNIETSLKREDFGALSDKEYQNMIESNKGVLSAQEIMKNYKESFITPEALKQGEKKSPSDKKTGNPDNGGKTLTVEVKYFENSDPEFWGFKGVAGMKDLLEELHTNFINPLKFKFFIKKLEEQETESSSGKEERSGKQLMKNEKSIIFKKLHEEYSKFKVGIPTGMLFYGPPGTGKTFLTKKLCQELGAGFIKKSAGEFGSSYVHQTSKNIHEFFKQAKAESEKGPIILFLDEIDSLVSKRGANVDASKAEEVSQFLQEFNNLEDAPNLIIIAATNRPDHLDSAILRSGRFDKKIYIGPPDFEARKEMFKIYIERKKRPHAPLDYNVLATLTEGYVASDIETICEDVSRTASKGILDLVEIMQDTDPDNDLTLKQLNTQLETNVISMKVLKKSIKNNPSSLKMVDMNIYTDWLKKIEH